MIGECDREGCKGYGDLLHTLDCMTTRLCNACRREFDTSLKARLLNDQHTRLEGAKARALAVIQCVPGAVNAPHEDAVEALILHRDKCRAFVEGWLAAAPRPAPAETTKETP